MFQPDLGSWLEVVAAIVFFKGLLELALIWRVFRHTPAPDPAAGLGSSSLAPFRPGAGRCHS